MQRHPVIGARILIGCDVHPFYVETVLYHHEAWNGQGYPTGLKGEEIPLSGTCVPFGGATQPPELSLMSFQFTVRGAAEAPSKSS